MSQQQSSLGSKFFHNMKKFVTPSPTPSSNSGSSQGTLPKTAFDAEIKAESILLEEYRHMSNLVIQILQERTNTFNIYFILIGIIVSGVAVTSQLIKNAQNDFSIISLMIFIFLFGVHFLFFERFLFLEKVYSESLLSMEMIKEIYIKQFQSQLPELDRAIHTRKNFNASKSFHPRNALVCMALALFGSSSLAGIIFAGYEVIFHTSKGYLISFPSTPIPYIPALLVGIATFVAFILRRKQYLR